MRRWYLATACLLGLAPPTRAEYILYIANLNSPTKNMSQSVGGVGGMTGSGMAFGMTPSPGGAGGGMLLTGGAIGVPPGGGVGMPGMGGAAGMPGMGGAVGMAPGGMAGGMRPPAMPGGPPGAPGTAEAEEEEDSLVVTVFEVKSTTAGYHKKFERGEPVRFIHPWGAVMLVAHSPMSEAILLKQPTVAQIFKAEREGVFKEDKDEKPSTDRVLQLARKALQLGLVNQCAEALDKAAELDKNNPVVAAYLKLKDELARKPLGDDGAEALRSKLLAGYQITRDEGHHYTLLHNSPNDNPAEVKRPLDRLEEGIRAYYYWWVLRGVDLPVPKTRLLAVLTDKKGDFARMQKTLTAGPTVADSFFARRENVTVVSSVRDDRPYQNLTRKFNNELQAFPRAELLAGKGKGPRNLVLLQADPTPCVAALLQKAMEEEGEKTAISHETARQLLFASGLLPRNVIVPEWVQFGAAGFFETPLQSPWGGVGAPSPYWLPRYKELALSKDHKLGATPGAALRRLVTDGFFRKAAGSDDAKAAEDRKAGRAAAWALVYFLAETKPETLRNYFKELGKMPRDLELDDKVLLECFARAAGCFSGGKVNDRELDQLAFGWDNYVRQKPLEGFEIHKKIREAYASMNAPPPPPPPGGNPGGAMPPPGMRPPGGGMPTGPRGPGN